MALGDLCHKALANLNRGPWNGLKDRASKRLVGFLFIIQLLPAVTCHFKKAQLGKLTNRTAFSIRAGRARAFSWPCHLELSLGLSLLIGKREMASLSYSTDGRPKERQRTLLLYTQEAYMSTNPREEL